MKENLIIHCPKCNAIVKIRNLQKHLRTVHSSQRQELDPNFLIEEETLKKFKSSNYDLLLKASYIWNTKILNDEQTKNRDEILDKLFSIISKYSASSSEFEYLEKVIQALEKKTTIQESRKTCEKIFITWDNIEFLNNTIKIKHKDYFSIKPIKITDSRESLNLIKVEYFKRLYQANIYKLYLKNNEVLEDISPDLKKIRNLIEIKLEKSPQKQKDYLAKERIFPKNADSTQIIETITSLPEHKFKFIKIAAKFLTEKDRVVAFDENNNSNIEESLIFIYNRPNLNYVLWENVNASRGAYIFEFTHLNFKLKFSRLLTLLKGPSKNKREKFYRSEDNFGIEYKSKKFLLHEDIYRFKWQIKSYLKKDNLIKNKNTIISSPIK